MLLPNHLIQRFRSQAVGEGRAFRRRFSGPIGYFLIREEVGHRR
jgi:hypothetical protein